MAHDDDQSLIEPVLERYRAEMMDYEQFWYLGHRFEYHPLVGYVHAPFASKTLNISKQGFRGPEYLNRNAHGNPRIAAFGPSALVGIPNSSDDTIITAYMDRRFEEAGRPAEVMNFGLICGRINNEMRMVSKFLVDYDIDAVVLLSGYNDGWSFTLGSLWEFQDIADVQMRGFAANRHRADPVYFLRLAWAAWKRSRLEAQAAKASASQVRGAERFFRGRRAQAIDSRPPVPVFETGEKLYLQFLGQIAALCAQAGKPFLYVFQPNLFTTAKILSPYEAAAARSLDNAFGQEPNLRAARIEQFSAFYRQLGQKARVVVEANGGRVFDADAHFAQAPDGTEIFFDECHYREAGNEIIGAGLADELMKVLGS
ncbi:MAG: hypothetical protein HY055_04765 [Magnetospirillum sp.]|nr:hypothetical protein [Magnetospirillum sp.]